MILGMTTSTFTLLHVLISLIGIGSGLVVMYGLLAAKRLDRWTALFLLSTVATSVSGFGFPFTHLLPSHKVGVLSLAVLAVAILARYGLHLNGASAPASRSISTSSCWWCSCSRKCRRSRHWLQRRRSRHFWWHNCWY